MNDGPKDGKPQSDYQVVRALALAEKLMARPDGAADPAPAVATTEAAPTSGDSLAKALGYWLWRAGGRPATTPDTERLAEVYERELERLAKRLEAEHAKAMARQEKRIAELERLTSQLQQAHTADVHRLRKELTAELSVMRATGESESERLARETRQNLAQRERAHEAEIIHLRQAHARELEQTRSAAAKDKQGAVAALERELTTVRGRIDTLVHAHELEIRQLNEAHARELSHLRASAARNGQMAVEVVARDLEEARRRLADLERQAPPPPSAALTAAEARAAEFAERARLAENKVEVLKEALDVTRARSAAGPATVDTRFREAKRAFARLFHPDQGGRADAAKERAFLEFWPVLDRIERGE